MHPSSQPTLFAKTPCFSRCASTFFLFKTTVAEFLPFQLSDRYGVIAQPRVLSVKCHAHVINLSTRGNELNSFYNSNLRFNSSNFTIKI